MGIVQRFLVLAYCAGSVALSAPVQRFVVSQAYPQLPEMKAYVDALDANGQPATNLAPANFSASVGTNAVQVTGITPFKDSGEGVAYAFLVDISKSISPADFGQMQAAITKWINGLRPADRAAICTFGNDYQIVTDFTADKQQLTSAVLNLAIRDSSTHLYQALRSAMEFEHRNDSELPMRRVIVMLSDGKDEGSAITADDVVHQLHSSHLPIYAIGYSQLRGTQRRQYLDVLRRFAQLSGGIYEEPVGHQIDQAYTDIQDSILRVFVLNLSCRNCAADGRVYPLQITLASEDRKLTSSIDVMPVSGPRGEPRGPGTEANPRAPGPGPGMVIPWWNTIPMWLYALIAVVVVAGAVLLVLKLMGGGAKTPPVPLAGPPPPVGSTASAAGRQSTGSIASTQPLQQGSTVKGGIPMQLAVITGRDRGRVYQVQLKKTIVIGRAKDCDVVLNDPRISNHHCEMALSKNAIVIYDLDSKNSTYVKGVPIRGRHKLENEDSLLLGETELRLRFDEDEVLTR